MASQSEPTTTTDVPNYAGPLFYVGATYGKSPLLSLAGLSRGGKTATGNQFPMANRIAGDSPAQDGQSEDASIAAMTATSYTGSQGTNYMQIFRKEYVVSYAAQAFQGAISGVAVTGMGQSVIAAMPAQRSAHLMQLAADYEYSALRGAGQAWTNAATAGKMGGLVTAIEAGSETAAAGAPLSRSLISEEIVRMAAAGADFGNTIIAGGAFQIDALNTLFGNALQSTTEAGIDLKIVNMPVMGQARIVYDPVLADDDLVFVDLDHFDPVFGIVPGKPAVFVEPLSKTAAGDREQLFALASVDYGHIQWHGMISGLATS